MVKNIFPIIIVCLFAFIAGFPLLHKGLPPTHDGEYHIVRFYEFYKTLVDGNLYPRWAQDLNNGFGIPLFNFVYPLPNYIASFFHFFGISFIDSFKLEMFFAILIGAVFFYLWAKEFWGKLGGIVSSVFYTFSPYHFLDVYIRGSVGEVWALAFFPAFLWLITRFIKYKQKIFALLSSIFLSLIIFSHNILALMFFFFAVLYIVFLIYQERDKKYLILNTFYIILLGIGLSSIFWLPALFERQYVTGLDIFDTSRHFPELYQLVIPSWGSGFSGESSLRNGFSFQIGIANLLAVFFSILICFMNRRKDKKIILSVLLFIIWFIIIFLLMLKISFIIWQKTPLMNYFQFPWRFLSLEILICSFLAGSIVYFWKSKIVATCLILGAFLLGMGYAKPAYYLERVDDYYFTRSNFIDGTNSPGNVFNTRWAEGNISHRPVEKLEFLKGKGEVKRQLVRTLYYRYAVKVFDKDAQLLVNAMQFPGWSVLVDKMDVKVNTHKDGRISFNIKEGLHIVEVVFHDTLVRVFGKVATFVSIIVLVFFLVGNRIKCKIFLLG